MQFHVQVPVSTLSCSITQFKVTSKALHSVPSKRVTATTTMDDRTRSSEWLMVSKWCCGIVQTPIAQRQRELRCVMQWKQAQRPKEPEVLLCLHSKLIKTMQCIESPVYFCRLSGRGCTMEHGTLQNLTHSEWCAHTRQIVWISRNCWNAAICTYVLLLFSWFQA